MKKNKKIIPGHFYSINSRDIVGHKAQVSKKINGSKRVVVVLTHSKYTRRRKNIQLNENPQKDDIRTSFVLKNSKIVEESQIGKHHKDMKVTNKVDKSIIRHIKNKKKKGWPKLNSYLSLSLLLVYTILLKKSIFYDKKDKKLWKCTHLIKI